MVGFDRIGASLNKLSFVFVPSVSPKAENDLAKLFLFLILNFYYRDLSWS